jgi:hypothetical protein
MAKKSETPVQAEKTTSKASTRPRLLTPTQKAPRLSHVRSAGTVRHVQTGKAPPTAEAFVTAWMKAVKQGGGKADVAKQLRMETKTVDNRFAYYTAKGVKLPKLPMHGSGVAGKKELDVARLNALIRKVGTGG